VLAGVNLAGYGGLTGRLGVGVSVRVTPAWGFMPEVTGLVPLEGRATLAGANFGFAIIGGGKHPYPTGAGGGSGE
jgi:hypothetical protein